MANKHRGEVELAGRTLRFTINSLCALEDVTGQGIVDLVAGFSVKAPRLTLVRSMLWAGLIDKHPETTPMDAGNIIEDVGLPAVTAAVREAFAASFPAPEAKTSAPPR